MRTATKLKTAGVRTVPDQTERHRQTASHKHANDMKDVMIVGFIKDYVLANADFMPHLWEAHLPAHNLTDLYRAYVSFSTANRLSPSSPQHFGKLFRRNFQAYVKFSAVRRFARCKTCDDLDDSIKVSKSDVVTTHFQLKKQRHLKACREEQHVYMRNKRLAILYPDKYISIAIDAMDQKKTSIPKILNSSKKFSEVEQMTISLMGVIIHGHAPGAIVYPVTPQFAKDGCLVMQILLNTLKRVREARGDNKWPKTLFLQLDNAPNQNKNRAVFSVLSALVQIGLFDRVHPLRYAVICCTTRICVQIELSFLPVGHTHCDVDQMFSCVSQKLGRLSYLTLSDMLKYVRGSWIHKHTDCPVSIEEVGQVRCTHYCNFHVNIGVYIDTILLP